MKKGYIFGYPQYIPQNLSDETLGFESRFECGNLAAAYNNINGEYHLYLKSDYGNEKYTNWFFFRVYNTRKNKKYKFFIKNMNKANSLFNRGMKLMIYSEKMNMFFRGGEKIVYYCNFIKKKDKTNHYSLYFELEFPQNFDTVYIGLNYVYTYSRVQSLQKYLKADKEKSQYFEHFNLC